MKILFAGMAKLKYMPYINLYLNRIDCDVHEVHISYWDRDGKEDCVIDKNVKLHCLRCDMSDAYPLTKKLPNFFKYRKHLKRVIKEVKPDLLIIHYQTTGVLIYDYLTNKYKGKFILDYRDVTYERINIFKKMVGKLVDCSYATFTSSDGFRKFLPKSEKIYNSHNILQSDIENRQIDLNRKTSDRIRIAFWGLIRHLSLNKELIEKLGNDERFELHYYGRAQGEMLEFLNFSTKHYDNVFFHGEYISKQRYDFVRNTDIIHNIYDNNDKTMPIAMGNKFYDGIVFYLPLLCMKDSFMGDLCDKYKIGLTCNPFDSNFADQVYDYYHSLDMKSFYESTDVFLKKVLGDIANAEQIIDSFINM